MEEVYTKIVKNTFVLHGMVPVSQEDADRLKVFDETQILKNKTTGVEKTRSVAQNAWVHAIFRFVANNTDDPEWNTERKVKYRVKLAIKFYEPIFVVAGQVWFEFGSFRFDKMKQATANKVYSEARLVCADFLGVDPKVLQARAVKETRLRG